MMQGDKTHEQLQRTLERKDDVAKPGEAASPQDGNATRAQTHPDARQSEFPVSRGGMHQETRGQNKHNDPGQTGHKPQRHGPAEEKR
jgi:hypothetical protein